MLMDLDWPHPKLSGNTLYLIPSGFLEAFQKISNMLAVAVLLWKYYGNHCFPIV